MVQLVSSNSLLAVIGSLDMGQRTAELPKYSQRKVSSNSGIGLMRQPGIHSEESQAERFIQA